MKKFLFLLLVTIVTLACGPIDSNGQLRDDHLKLGDLKYTYQVVDGYSVMIIQGIDQNGNYRNGIIPIDPSILIDTIHFNVSEEIFQKEYKRFVDWYKENHYDEYYYETKEALDIVNKIIQEYKKE